MIVTSQAGFSNGSISSALWFLALLTRVLTAYCSSAVTDFSRASANTFSLPICFGSIQADVWFS
jgi:hypothetical protein